MFDRFEIRIVRARGSMLEQHVILFTPPSAEFALNDLVVYEFYFAKKRRKISFWNDNEADLSRLNHDGILKAQPARSYGQLARLTRH